MVTIGMNYKVLPGKEETFEKTCTGVIEAMAGIEGHSESFLYKDVNNGQSYLIASEWNSEDAFNEFIQSDKFKQVTNWGKESILAGRPSHKVYKQ
ncbi:antibiotic biosynthesis monooxygenase [Candidatus Nitromaritima sp. SCGC AAA799-C22]|nr:antibiotic biosynthesis monooxygenase [Candidatus Nitromaritima sp. SCGC AAA799-C22]